MNKEDEILFGKIANNAELRQKWLRDAKDLMPDHPAVREQRILDEATSPLLREISELKERLDKREHTDRYESERAKMRTAPYNFNDKRIAELEERMAKAAKDEGVVFDSYPHAAEYIRRMDMPLSSSSVALGLDFGIGQSGAGAGTEKWREDMASSDPKQNPALMSRRDRKRYVRRLAQEASEEFKSNLGVR